MNTLAGGLVARQVMTRGDKEHSASIGQWRGAYSIRPAFFWPKIETPNSQFYRLDRGRGDQEHGEWEYSDVVSSSRYLIRLTPN